MNIGNGGNGTVTSIKSPFGDSSEVVGGGGGGEGGGKGGIKVHKTVEVSRVESDGSSVGSAPTPWGSHRHGYGEGDLV